MRRSYLTPRFAATLTFTVFIAGCGSKVSGTYSGHGRGFFDKMTFKSNGKVEITFMTMTKEGSFTVDGKSVKITNAGDTQVFTIDDRGCLDGGGLLGKYCRDDAGGGNTTRGLSGSYRAGDARGGITLRFQNDQKVHMTVAERGAPPENADGTFNATGDRVTISVPGGRAMVLQRKVDALEGTFDGRTIRFVRE